MTADDERSIEAMDDGPDPNPVDVRSAQPWEERWDESTEGQQDDPAESREPAST